MELKDFYKKHDGETCLIVGVGANLELTPPEWFDYPSFGVNTIYKRKGNWKPTYLVGVDERLEREDGQAISEIYKDIPKFIPYPDRDSWKGENFYRFYHRSGLMFVGGMTADHPQALTHRGIAYHKIMEVVMQIAWHMGFTTMLMIGVQHKPDGYREHFWGLDKESVEQSQQIWFDGYRDMRNSMGNKVRVLNISEDTYVSEDYLPRDNYRNWIRKDIQL